MVALLIEGGEGALRDLGHDIEMWIDQFRNVILQRTSEEEGYLAVVEFVVLSDPLRQV